MNTPGFIRLPVPLVCCLAVVFLAAPLLAQPPADPLATADPGPPTVSIVHFGTPTLPPLPADFFGPGSDPFEGQVALQGNPLSPGSTGDASTLVQRDADPVQPADPVGTMGTVPIELIELSLTGTQPIVVEYYGGALQEAWEIQVGESVVPAPAGILQAVKTHENGGTFDSLLFVQPRFVFTRVDDGTEVIYDTGLEGLPPLEQGIGGAPWVHLVDPLLDIVAPSDGTFVPGIEETLPGDPASQCPTAMAALEPFGSLDHFMIPPTFFPPPDPFVSEPGDGLAGTNLEFGAPSNPPLPADFFGPGSDPFEGQVCLEGEPLGPTPWGDFHDADTLILRGDDPFDRCELPPLYPRTIDIEIVALSLRSIEPIVVTYHGGLDPELWDVEVDLSTEPGTRGEAMVFKVHANGGTFDSFLPVQPRYTFTRQSDAMTVELDTGLAGYPPLQYEFMGCEWVHEKAPHIHVLAPSNGTFVPGVAEPVPGDPASQIVVSLPGVELGGAGQHVLWPAPDDLSPVKEVPAVASAVRVFPNPFNPTTTIAFQLERPGPVRLRVFDLHGSLVRTLVDGHRERGAHRETWQAVDDAGRRVASGVYLAILEADGGVRTSKMAVIK